MPEWCQNSRLLCSYNERHLVPRFARHQPSNKFPSNRLLREIQDCAGRFEERETVDEDQAIHVKELQYVELIDDEDVYIYEVNAVERDDVERQPNDNVFGDMEWEPEDS